MSMEWQCQEKELLKMDKANNNTNGDTTNECCSVGVGGTCVMKVMTDEQLEVLRKQISVYATICERLVQMHKAATAQQDFCGMVLGNMDYDPLLVSAKMTSRQRWTPTAMQLQILEHIFIQGNGTPTKQRIKEITSELTRHGQVSEANVYNWFQNRRARLKKKQLLPASATSEKETEIEVDSPKDETTISGNLMHQDNLKQMDGITQLHSAETRAEAFCIDTTHRREEPLFTLDSHLRSSTSLSEIGFEHLVSKMDAPVSFDPYGYSLEFDLVG